MILKFCPKSFYNDMNNLFLNFLDETFVFGSKEVLIHFL